MKSKKYILLIVILLAAILLTTTTASAKTTRIDFTGSEWCDPDTLMIDKIQPAGPNLHIKHITSVCYDTASIPQLTGIDHLTDGDVHFAGPNWILVGNLRMESNEGGVWVGSWVLPANSTTIQVVAHGEGMYEGMELHWFLDAECDVCSFSGYIIMP